MGAKRFRVAFTCAGEKRDFVEKVAGLLAQSFGEEAILYDKFHEAEFSITRLGRYLPRLYCDQSDLVVVVTCRDYAGKEWCGLEWDAIFDLLKQGREREVMLSRFDQAIVDGLFSDAGFCELNHKTPEQFAALILERLALNEGKPKDYYAKCSSAGGKVPNEVHRTQKALRKEPRNKGHHADEKRKWILVYCLFCVAAVGLVLIAFFYLLPHNKVSWAKLHSTTVYFETASGNLDYPQNAALSERLKKLGMHVDTEGTRRSTIYGTSILFNKSDQAIVDIILQKMVESGLPTPSPAATLDPNPSRLSGDIQLKLTH